MSSKYVKWFKEIGIEDVPEVGGKNASLGEMYQNLTAEGVRVPDGFAVTASAYKYILDYNDAWRKLHEQLDDLQRNKRHSGICGQAPSDYPEVAEFLVKLGIDSISLNPDSVLKTLQDVVRLEKELGGGEKLLNFVLKPMYVRKLQEWISEKV